MKVILDLWKNKKVWFKKKIRQQKSLAWSKGLNISRILIFNYVFAGKIAIIFKIMLLKPFRKAL